MSKPKQQHVVPKVYLKNFCADTNTEQIYFLDKMNKRTGLTNIANVAKEKDFYSDVLQEDRYAFEKYFSGGIEPKMGKLFKRIRSAALLCSDKTPLFNEEDRMLLSEIIVTQMLRTHSAKGFMREKMNAITIPLIEHMLALPQLANNEQVRLILEEYRVLDEPKFKQIILPLITDDSRISRLAERVDSMMCTLYDNQTEVDFCTSDEPVIITHIGTSKAGLGRAGLDSPNCMIIYPLSPRLAVVLVHGQSVYASAFRPYENAKIPITQVEIVQTFNQLQFIQANRQVYSQSPFTSDDWHSFMSLIG